MHLIQERDFGVHFAPGTSGGMRDGEEVAHQEQR